MLVHDRGYLITAQSGGGFAFFRPDGAGIPPSPALPPPDGTIGDCHDAGITPGTIIPPWYGERLNLDDAIYACLASARTPQERQDQRDQADDPELFRPRQWVIEAADWIQHIRDTPPPDRGEDQGSETDLRALDARRLGGRHVVARC